MILAFFSTLVFNTCMFCKMDSSAKHPASYIENAPERDKRSTFATDEIMLLSPNEADNTHEYQSPSLSGNTVKPKKAGKRFPGLASIRRKNDNFWKAWHDYSNKPGNMCLLVVIGTVFAIGHHLFYLNLNGKEATDQSRMLRYGTIIAFCAKACLGTAVAMAFYQRAYVLPSYRGSIKKAKIGTLLAIYCWVTPLVVVLTSETLSVGVGVKEELTSCLSGRTLNFKNEEEVYWRDPRRIAGEFLTSMSLWNTTFNLDEDQGNYTPTSNKFDYFAGHSSQCETYLAKKPLLMGEAIVRKESAAEICAEGWNCSYVVDFVAPGYKCQELATGVDSEVKKLGDATAPFNTSAIAPMGNHT
ncbi:hypothetical protein ACHAP5_003779 [Fusarium lateritium]